MAARKKTSGTSSRKSATASRRTAARPAAKAAGRRVPPMHAPTAHPELDEPGAGEHDEVFEIFRTYDRDNSGSIDRAELAHLLEALGMELSEDELAIALDAVDVNHSGRVSWPEFRAWWTDR